MTKFKIEIELDHDSIMFPEWIKPEIEEWIRKLAYRHLTSVKLTNIKEVK